MALRQQNMVEVATGTNALELQAEAGESIRVKRIQYYSVAPAAEDVDISVDRVRVMQWVAPSGLNLAFSRPQDGIRSIIEQLWLLGMHPTIPVAEGQVLTCTAPGSSNFLEVTYDLFDAGDVQANEPNGSRGTTYDLFQVVSNSAAVTAAGDVALDQSDLDRVFPDFPGDPIAPSRQTFDLTALFGGPASRGDGAGSHTQDVERIRMIADRVDLFDKDLNGFLYQGDTAITAATVDYTGSAGAITAPDDGVPPRLRTFDQPLRFTGGSELNVFATVDEDNAGGDLAAGDIVLGLLFRVQRST